MKKPRKPARKKWAASKTTWLPGQLPLFLPESDWRPPSLQEVADFLPRDGVAAFDIETNDPHIAELGAGLFRADTVFCGFSVATPRGGLYVPLAHAEDNVEDPVRALELLRSWAAEFRGHLTGAYLSYDLGHMMARGVEFKSASIRDIQVADPLLYELHRSYSLQAISERFKLPGKDEKLLKHAAACLGISNPKLAMHRLPARFVAPYAIQDAKACVDVLELQEKEIVSKQLERVWELERKITPILVKMRHRGVQVNQDKLSEIMQWSSFEEDEKLAFVRDYTGIEIKVGETNNKELMGRVLEQLGITVEKTSSGQDRIDKQVLTSADHPVCSALLRAKKMDKLRSFGRQVFEHLVNGRVHPTFNQMRSEDEFGAKGAAFGRMSCESPNMQQQPSKDDFADRWRSIYEPGQDRLWACLDFSSQEPRMAIHFAEKADIPGAKRIGDQFRRDPKTDLHQMMSDLTGLSRTYAKQIFLGLLYGMGGGTLADRLGLPTEEWVTPDGYSKTVAGTETKEILRKYHNNVPFVNHLVKLAQSVAGERGYVKTLYGRRCHFPMVNGKFDWLHKALNRIIQGSSADQMKQGMIDLEEAGFELQLQVHDEVDLPVKSVEEAQEAGRILCNSVNLTVPTVVDVEVGPSWGEIKKV